jgi:hypothetical protein
MMSKKGVSHVKIFRLKKITFFRCILYETIMLSFLRDYFINKFCYFFRFELHKSQKISRKWTSMMSKIEIDETFL